MKAEIWKPFQSANIGKKTLSVDPNMHGWWEWIPKKSRNHESSEIWSHCPGVFRKVSFYIHRCPNWTYTCVWMDILYTEPCSSSSNGEYPFSTVTRSLLSKHMDSWQLQKALQQNHQIFMESPLVHGPSYMGLIFIIVIVLFALAHARLTKLDVFSALKRFEQWRQQEKPEVTQKQLDQERRYEEELLRTRMQILAKLNTILIHIGFAQICLALPDLLHEPSFSSLAEFTALVLAYSWHAFAETQGPGINHILIHCWTALFCMVHILIFASSVNSEDSLRVSITEKLCGLGSIMMLGFKWLVFHLVSFFFLETWIWLNLRVTSTKGSLQKTGWNNHHLARWMMWPVPRMAVALVDLKITLPIQMMESGYFVQRHWGLIEDPASRPFLTMAYFLQQLLLLATNCRLKLWCFFEVGCFFGWEVLT